MRNRPEPMMILTPDNGDLKRAETWARTAIVTVDWMVYLQLASFPIPERAAEAAIKDHEKLAFAPDERTAHQAAKRLNVDQVILLRSPRGGGRAFLPCNWLAHKYPKLRESIIQTERRCRQCARLEIARAN